MFFQWECLKNIKFKLIKKNTLFLYIPYINFPFCLVLVSIHVWSIILKVFYNNFSIFSLSTFIVFTKIMGSNNPSEADRYEYYDCK